MTRRRGVLIVDDEPEYLRWLDDFLETNGYEVKHATTFNDAAVLVDELGFELVIVDLNIPAAGTLIEFVANKGPIATKFPGLLIAARARNRGYSQRQVVAYTVHADDAVEQELATLGCSYVLKGRPQQLKARIASTLKLRARKK